MIRYSCSYSADLRREQQTAEVAKLRDMQQVEMKSLAYEVAVVWIAEQLPGHCKMLDAQAKECAR